MKSTYSKYATEFYQCMKCDDLCHVEEIDAGGYEEFWGAQVWRQEWEVISECCGDEVEELTQEEAEALEEKMYG